MSLALAVVFASLSLILGAAVAVAERRPSPPLWVGRHGTYMLWAPAIVGLGVAALGEAWTFLVSLGEQHLGLPELTLIGGSAAAAVIVLGICRKRLRTLPSAEVVALPPRDPQLPSSPRRAA